MKSVYVLLAATAIFASAACNAEKAGSSAAAPKIEAIKAPNGDWSKLVSRTPEGGYLMGNPKADVKLVEYGSMTCPHCAEFEEKGGEKLINDYVKTGRVSYEFRNFVRDPLDITMSMITRCAGPDRFFQLTRAAYTDQRKFFDALQAAPADQQQALQAMQGPEAFPTYARLSGLQQWAAQRGLPSAKSNVCLANQEEANLLVQMNGDATTQYPEFTGTPSFTINGTLLKETATWDKLEPQIRDALGS